MHDMDEYARRGNHFGAEYADIGRHSNEDATLVADAEVLKTIYQGNTQIEDAHPRGMRPQTHHQFPFANRNSAVDLGTFTRGLSMNKDVWLFGEEHGLPIFETEKTNVRWDTVSFQQGVLDVQPEETPFHIMESNYSVKYASTQRMGKGIKMERGFMKTFEGYIMLMKKLQQLSLTVQRTMTHVIMRKLLACGESNLTLEKLAEKRSTDSERIMDNNVANFAIMQKGERRVFDMLDTVKRSMYGIKANTLILPTDMDKYLIGADDASMSYQESGPDALKRRRMTMGSVKSIGGVTIKNLEDAPMFSGDDMLGSSTRFNQLIRTVQIGTFNYHGDPFKANDRFEGPNQYSYRTAKRDIYIHNANADIMQRMIFIESVTNSRPGRYIYDFSEMYLINNGRQVDMTAFTADQIYYGYVNAVTDVTFKRRWVYATTLRDNGGDMQAATMAVANAKIDKDYIIGPREVNQNPIGDDDDDGGDGGDGANEADVDGEAEELAGSNLGGFIAHSLNLTGETTDDILRTIDTLPDSAHPLLPKYRGHLTDLRNKFYDPEGNPNPRLKLQPLAVLGTDGMSMLDPLKVPLSLINIPTKVIATINALVTKTAKAQKNEGSTDASKVMNRTQFDKTVRKLLAPLAPTDDMLFEKHAGFKLDKEAVHLMNVRKAVGSSIENARGVAVGVAGDADSTPSFKMDRIRQLIVEEMEQDIPVAVNCILLRNMQYFETYTAIYAKMGKNTGRCILGKNDVVFEGDGHVKTHFIHLTQYIGVVIKEEENIRVIRDIATKKYLTGKNCDFISEKENDRRQKNKYKKPTERRAASILSFLVPYGFKCNIVNLDMTVYPPHGPNDSDIHTFVRYAWDIMYAHLKLGNNRKGTRKGRNKVNTLCRIDHQEEYNIYKDDFTAYRRGRGHLGENIYAGMMDVIDGNMSCFKDMEYAKRFDEADV